MLNPSTASRSGKALVPLGRPSGEQGSILPVRPLGGCSESAVLESYAAGPGFERWEPSKFLGGKPEKPETDLIVTRTTERVKGHEPSFRPARNKSLAAILPSLRSDVVPAATIRSEDGLGASRAAIRRSGCGAATTAARPQLAQPPRPHARGRRPRRRPEDARRSPFPVPAHQVEQQSPGPDTVSPLGASASGHDRLTLFHQSLLLQLAGLRRERCGFPCNQPLTRSVRFMSCRGRFHPVQGLGATKPATCNQTPSSVQPHDITAAFSRVVPRKGFRRCSALVATTQMQSPAGDTARHPASPDSTAGITSPSARRRRHGSAIDRSKDLQRTHGTGRNVYAAGPMSCRGPSGRGVRTPDSGLHVQLLAPM